MAAIRRPPWTKAIAPSGPVKLPGQTEAGHSAGGAGDGGAAPPGERAHPVVGPAVRTGVRRASTCSNVGSLELSRARDGAQRRVRVVGIFGDPICERSRRPQELALVLVFARQIISARDRGPPFAGCDIFALQEGAPVSAAAPTMFSPNGPCVTLLCDTLRLPLPRGVLVVQRSETNIRAISWRVVDLGARWSRPTPEAGRAIADATTNDDTSSQWRPR